MQKLIHAMLAMMILQAVFAGGTNTPLQSHVMPPGMKGSYGTEQAEILAIFSAEENGARFRAYHIKRNGHDVIVSDMFGQTEFKKGDTITFMVQNVEIPVLDKTVKMLQFMIMDTSLFTRGKETANFAEP